MDTSAVIEKCRTFVLISIIATVFGVGYTWDNATNTVLIQANIIK